MKSELLSQEKNIVTIKVTVDKDDFAKQLRATYADIAKKVVIPGFRKGKAPKNVLEMRFGKEAIYSACHCRRRTDLATDKCETVKMPGVMYH